MPEGVGGDTQASREARILARRKRIQERLASLHQGDAAGGKEGEKREEAGKGKQQIFESRRRLFRVKHRTDGDVTSVRVAGDTREQSHRVQEEQTRQELRSKLLSEAELSARQNAAVAMRWADLFSIEVPQDLYEEIEKQRTACERIILSKDRLIGDIKTELKRKDDEFVKTLKRQAEDIDSLLQYMSRQFVEMQASYKEELTDIETAFLQERANLLGSNKSEMQELFDRRSRLEQEFMERYLASVENYQALLDALRVSDAEDYHILKIRLETDIQNLEQHLETMRATYQLNTEKLEYNYRVLVERDHENQATINQQKRKISRQRDILSGLKQRYNDTEKRYLEENMKLTDEYKRTTEQFKDLQGKFRLFEAVDTKKYAEVWAMKEEEVADVAKQLLQADKVLHEQQLGWDWRPPNEAVFSVGGAGQQAEARLEDEEGEDAEAAATARGEAEVSDRIHDARYTGALGLLCDEAGFLVDSRARAVLEKLPRDEAGLIRAESVLRALGVADGAAFDALMRALRPESNIEMRAKGKGGPGGMIGGGGNGEAEGEDESGSLVHPDDVVRRLKAYIEVESTASSRPGVAGPQRAVGVARRAAEVEAEFWGRMERVISAKGGRVWGVLEKQLERYMKLLETRSSSLNEVESLQHQNNELRALLNQYLGSRINSELVVPPTVMI
ncbi:hypothetical protein FOA52_004331 [Chlamydomonas sp. UWO 241]|nr:hypothetical protein FOA52_004331 [Chlamydomonas sp. UWO 241]